MSNIKISNLSLIFDADNYKSSIKSLLTFKKKKSYNQFTRLKCIDINLKQSLGIQRKLAKKYCRFLWIPF